MKELLILLRSSACLPAIHSFDSEDKLKSKRGTLYGWWLPRLPTAFSTSFSAEELEQFETECEDLFLHFQHRNLDAMVAAVKSTLDTLRKRITTRCHTSLGPSPSCVECLSLPQLCHPELP